MSKNNSQICFIGGGNMAHSLIGGLISNGSSVDDIVACDINADILGDLAQRYGINISQNSKTTVESADIIILALKPQVLQQVCRDLADSNFKSGVLFISIAAGIREQDINHWLGDNRAVVRCMPNTPALVGLGATALYANEQVSRAKKVEAEAILSAVGITVWVERQAQLDAVTAISGSGPAYFFLFIEILQNAAVELGLEPAVAQKLAQQTALGAATMAIGNDVTKLREQVTSKGGTTEQAIASFQQQGLDKLVKSATLAANNRSIELADILSK